MQEYMVLEKYTQGHTVAIAVMMGHDNSSWRIFGNQLSRRRVQGFKK